MKKRFTLSTILIFLLLNAGFSLSAEFGPDSANITNPYMPLKVGSGNVLQGYGVNSGFWIYFDAVAVETVGTIKGVRVNLIYTESGSFITLWLAQDTEGNVWVLKAYNRNENRTLLLGQDFENWLMPATPAVGLNVGLTISESGENNCTVVGTGETLSLSTGIGTLTDCISVLCTFDDGGREVEVYCPNYGMSKIFVQGDLTSGYELMELGAPGCKGDFDEDGDVDGFDLNAFSKIFGGPCP